MSTARDLEALNTSMRPPQNAGENPLVARGPALSLAHFNEAPAKRGGEHDFGSVHGMPPNDFNEAPAKRGGEQADPPWAQT